MNYVREYWRKIESGEIITSRRVKAVYGRLVREMDEPPDGSPWYFDEETGERPIIFVERFCKQSQGTLGATLELDLFQKAFIQTLFGWLERATGYRRFRETLFLVGRKNGKSTLLAALALYLLVADYEGAAEIYSVATKKDQAKKTLTEAVNMVKQSPELRAVLKKRRNDIYFPATASIFEALASDSNTLDVLNSHAVIIDELHAIRDRNLYEVMKQSTSSRRQPLVIMITTSWRRYIPLTRSISSSSSTWAFYIAVSALRPGARTFASIPGLSISGGISSKTIFSGTITSPSRPSSRPRTRSISL